MRSSFAENTYGRTHTIPDSVARGEIVYSKMTKVLDKSVACLKAFFHSAKMKFVDRLIYDSSRFTRKD